MEITINTNWRDFGNVNHSLTCCLVWREYKVFNASHNIHHNIHKYNWIISVSFQTNSWFFPNPEQRSIIIAFVPGPAKIDEYLHILDHVYGATKYCLNPIYFIITMPIAQIAKTPTSNRHPFDTKVSERCTIEIAPLQIHKLQAIHTIYYLYNAGCVESLSICNMRFPLCSNL